MFRYAQSIISTTHRWRAFIFPFKLITHPQAVFPLIPSNLGFAVNPLYAWSSFNLTSYITKNSLYHIHFLPGNDPRIGYLRTQTEVYRTPFPPFILTFFLLLLFLFLFLCFPPTYFDLTRAGLECIIDIARSL